MFLANYIDLANRDAVALFSSVSSRRALTVIYTFLPVHCVSVTHLDEGNSVCTHPSVRLRDIKQKCSVQLLTGNFLFICEHNRQKPTFEL